MDVPLDLIEAVAERRVIPFVGAGFSASVGLPDWGQLLSKLANETEGSLKYSDLQKFTGDDYLQIAEYLYLKSDKRIGPLRHVIERGLPPNVNPAGSAAHVELVNLGAPQIYTTNYDDLIESTYRALGLPVNVVALGRDVAVAGTQTTQVVKYHGDLRHESTLVLTESSYFRRLDFESAMDVKFRADLLGRSVLFMGYSFRDINIRLIWFKLNQMMEEIPTADRRQSYIVRVEPNPVLEALYDAVGLKTLVLDQASEPRRTRGVDALVPRITSLSQFLSRLSERAAAKCHDCVPGSADRLFVSEQSLGAAERTLDEFERRLASRTYFLPLPPSIGRVLGRRVPDVFEQRVNAIAARLLVLPLHEWSLLESCIRRVQPLGPSGELTKGLIRALLRTGDVESDIRARLLAGDLVDWSIAWKGYVEDVTAEMILERLDHEIDYNEGNRADDDIAFAAFLATPIRDEQWPIGGNADLARRATNLLDRAAQIYPSIHKLALDPDRGKPSVEEVRQEIADRRASLPPDEDDEEDEDHDGLFYESMSGLAEPDIERPDLT